MRSRASSGFCEHARPQLRGAEHAPLSALTFAVKDVLAIAGVKSCYGNPRWLETHPAAPAHARAVQQLLTACAASPSPTSWPSV
jgi:amidase